jgi:hypothetical protein
MGNVYDFLVGHLEESAIGRFYDAVIGQMTRFTVRWSKCRAVRLQRPPGFFQVTSLDRSARATASARLETPSLDRMLLT